MYDFQFMSLFLISFSKLDNKDQRTKEWTRVSPCVYARVQTRVGGCCCDLRCTICWKKCSISESIHFQVFVRLKLIASELYDMYLSFKGISLFQGKLFLNKYEGFLNLLNSTMVQTQSEGLEIHYDQDRRSPALIGVLFY